MRITLKKLEKAKACSRERRRFARLFPNGCELNEKNLRKWAHGTTLAGLEATLIWFGMEVVGWSRAAAWRGLTIGNYWRKRDVLVEKAIRFFAKKPKRKRRKK